MRRTRIRFSNEFTKVSDLYDAIERTLKAEIADSCQRFLKEPPPEKGDLQFLYTRDQLEPGKKVVIDFHLEEKEFKTAFAESLTRAAIIACGFQESEVSVNFIDSDDFLTGLGATG